MTVSLSRGIVDVDILKVVLAGAADDQLFFGHPGNFTSVGEDDKTAMSGTGLGRLLNAR